MSTAEIPITVVSGPLGAGKTTLVNRLLNDPGDRDIAVVVNDMGELNVDAELVASEADDGVVDLSNGCICCRLQDDLVTEVTRLAETRSFDYLLIEASGISEPLPIARALTGESNEGGLPERLRLDTTVSVIDAYGFWKAFDPEESLPDAAPDPERPLTEVLVEQVEFCDVLLLNKCDMVPDDALDAVEAEIRELQPRASLHRTTYSEVDPTRVLDTGRFDFEATKRHQGWKRALTGDGAEADHDHEHTHDDAASAATAHGVESFVYRRDRPFHPQRLDAWLDDWRGNVVRAKGFAWVASRPEAVLGVSQAGPSVQAGPIGRWGDDDPETRLVFIGRDLDEDAVTRELDECLATTDERRAAYPDDPFPRESA
ncbi:cobalamin biosynthesis protein CobW [Haloferax sp. Atlit-4N]|uniref:CobW family GTP-binding protein n=1 Tax=Haloferax sp. Atlit-4N TaxID=2077206 RepID=UPI000E25BB6C|nr:GTP-binding protein [Haloferax sp. Atlit-4N]RDZ51140.1 cobalamin biosynthesis protein CobW [Haloferax sp. Atlit-4N]